MRVFYSKRELFWFLVACLLLFFINLGYKYIQFYTFLNNGEQEIVAKVENSYIKTNQKGKDYRVLLLRTDDFKFYTTTLKNRNFNPSDSVYITVLNLDVSFFDYLKGSFYMPNLKIKRVESKRSIKDSVARFISSQHEDKRLSELYSALFLATPISSELRGDIMRWGVSHLVAISGYHLGLILAIFYIVLTPILRYFYARFCPYRNYKIDVFAISFLFIILYFFILGFVPSFLRAFLMAIFGFYLLVRNLKIISFGNLFIVVCISLAIFINLAFSIGFYLSVMGVFYIFLYLKHFSYAKNNFLNFMYLNIYLFFIMQIVVLYFFPLISFQQFFVIPISYIFSLFYPLSVLLHIFGAGDFFDGYIINFIDIRLYSKELLIYTHEFLIYNALSVFAIKYKKLALLLPLCGVICFFSLV